MTSTRRPSLHPLTLSLLLGLAPTAWGQSTAPETPATPAKRPVPADPAERARPAAPPAREADSPQQLDRVEIQGIATEDNQRRASTASKIIIGRDEIERYGDSTIGEVLKRLPGVTTGGRPGRGGEVRMRGMGGGYTQILVNGERMPPGFSLDELPPEQIERIEVMRAPTAEFGARAIAGTINVVLREALQRRINDLRVAITAERDRITPNFSWSRNDKLNESGDAYNLTVNASQNKRQDDVNASSLTHRKDTGTDTLLQTLGQSEDERKSLNMTGRLQLRLEGGDTLAIQPFVMVNRGESASSNRQIQTPKPAATDPDFSRYDNARSDGDSRSEMGRLNVQWMKRISETTRVDTRVGAGVMSMTSNSHREEYNGTTFYRTQDDRTKSRDTNWSANAKFTHQMENESSLVAGVEGEGTDRDQDRLCAQSYDLSQPARNCAYLADFGDNVNASTRRFAAYAQDEWNVGKAWSFYAGLRWEGIKTTSSSSQGAVSNTTSVVTPLLHALYKIDEKNREQIRASITRSYKSPNLNDLVGRLSINNQYPCDDPTRPCTTNSINYPDRMGNPDLKPEMATGLEIGYEKYMTKGGLMSANFFYRRITDLIRTQPLLEAVPYAPVERWVTRPRNIGNAKTYGVELEAKFRLDEFIDEALPINLRSNLSLFKSAVDGIPGPNNRLDQQPKYTANLGADYRLRSIPLSLGGSLNYTPANTLQQSDLTQSFTDPKRVFDVFAMWSFSPSLQLRLSASNLAPLDYGTRSLSETQDRIIASQSSGRTFTVWQVRMEMKI